MNRLNYFNPYASKPLDHEDQLTRSYLVLLRHSFHAFTLFFDYLKSRHVIDESKNEADYNLSDLVQGGWEFGTQQTNPNIATSWLLSVAITDFTSDISGIKRSERDARYDGVIVFGDKLTIIIENKPSSENIWTNQLNPATSGLSEETQIFHNSACLEWKEIVKRLTGLLNLPSVSGSERLMIEDFLFYIDDKFPLLNPFDNFQLCKGNSTLISRRIVSLLRSMVVDEDLVKYHQRWGCYIETPYEEIRKIGLILEKDEQKQTWSLALTFYFGETQSQAKAFYNAKPSIHHLTDDWDQIVNFHVAFSSSNLVWFRSAPDVNNYIEFWKNNQWEICQQKRHEVPEYIEWLREENVLNISSEDESQLKEKFYDTAMQTLNICPGFGVVYSIDDEKAEQLDKEGVLLKLLIGKIKEGLRVISKDGTEFLKVL